MGDPSTGFGYSYLNYRGSPENIKASIIRYSDPTKLAAVGLEQAYQNFLAKEPPEGYRRRMLYEESFKKSSASKP